MADSEPQQLRDNVKWYAVYTNIRCEFRAFKGLRASGFDAFLPTFEKQVGRHGRKKHFVTRPTLTRYLFVAVEQKGSNNFATVRSTDGVEDILRGANGEPIQIPPEMIASIRLVDKYGEVLPDEPEAIESVIGIRLGDEIRLKEGAFSDFVGILRKIRDERNSVDILLNIFGRKTLVTNVPIEIVEPP